MSSVEDEDLARAIALSLQGSGVSRTGTTRQIEAVVISDDEAEEERRFQADLRRAIGASKQEESQPTTHKDGQCIASRAPNIPSFLSERVHLEKERLARQKRLRPDIDVESEGDDDGHKEKRQNISSTPSGERRANGRASSSGASTYGPVANGSASWSSLHASPSVQRPGEQFFWNGELRQIANMHVDRTKDTLPTFCLTDVLAPRDDIAFAIVSSYVFKFPWLYSFFNPSTPVIAVAQNSQGQETIKMILPNWVRTTPFLRNGMGCMHMKFMLLFYKSRRLRVVVSTANMVEYDWRDIENTVWLQDIPARSVPIPHDPKAEDFAAAMIRVLRAVNVAPAILSHLHNDHPDLPLQRLEHLRTHWDFSKVKAYLIPSIAGKHEGWPKVILAGHTALMKAVRDVGATLTKGKQLVLECQGSSIGTYSTQWMNEFYCSARGESAQSWLGTSKGRRAKLPFPSIKILFPTLQYVRDSALGETGGGTMFCRRNQWEGAKFPRELFYHSVSKRGRILMHSKMIIATFRERSSASGKNDTHSDSQMDEEGADKVTKDKLIGWVYIGSHNFTPSAWGTLSGSAFNPTLNITNYELGILLPLGSEKDADRVACWERPPKKYILGQDEPWIQSESPVFATGG